jgi:predicted  nucleic acid-binding Zn-ribbon protein
MAKQKGLTKEDLLETLAEFYHGRLKPEFDDVRKEMRDGFQAVNRRFQEVDNRFQEIDKRFDKVDSELSGIKDEIDGLKAELSDVPNKKEFNELKARVDRYHPSS